MAALSSLIMGLGFVTSAVGMGVQYVGMQKAAKAQERAEAIRLNAMKLDAARERRQQVREMMLQRATAVSNASSQGASQGSAIQGGLAQITNQGIGNVHAVNQNEILGERMFRANADIAKGNSMASLGGGIQSLGGMLVNNRGVFGSIG